jgi:hypothetical protein
VKLLHKIEIGLFHSLMPVYGCLLYLDEP